ncbi:hypothetical protein GCM10007047_31620 [Cerasicoccus arenae]|uniref:Uncharacterized protein n=1 Tax=Cerasicoccus arenae TaxID=424488 RepID=A0A8J3GFJ1_9BACT|nr:hypothetical protein GCM10007047_31620 [Cerasicoccus arenae]
MGRKSIEPGRFKATPFAKVAVFERPVLAGILKLGNGLGSNKTGAPVRLLSVGMRHRNHSDQ